jgi:arsenate reductase
LHARYFHIQPRRHFDERCDRHHLPQPRLRRLAQHPAAIRAAGIEPNVVEYLKDGWTKPQLKEILKKLGLTARDVLRIRGTPAEEMQLTDPSTTDEEIIDAMVGHPILVERPIVITPKGAVLARPAEKVEAIL